MLRRRCCSSMFLCAALALLCLAGGVATAAEEAWPRFPKGPWPTCTPEEAGLQSAPLAAIAEYLGGRGCIVRHGAMAFHWGDFARRGDVASAAKPWYSALLFMAVEEGLLESPDVPIAEYEPRIKEINPELGFKDRAITFAHMANQISCYGVSEKPGTAYDYNDFQMALFFDTLFLKVYGATLETVDEKVLHPRLSDVIGCEDDPTFLAFGLKDRPARLGISPRDFARFGWLFLNKGMWDGRQVLSAAHVRELVSSPIPNAIPRTSAHQAQMIPGQRSHGSRRVPDDQTDHYGSYSWLWWLNGVDREGRRIWPDAPLDVFTALGHANGQRGIAVMPSLDIVIAWNDTTLGNRPSHPHPLNEVFRLLRGAAEDAPLSGQVIPYPDRPAWLARNQDLDEDRRLDPLSICGPGDPEDFLYRGARNPDGTRAGDQMAIIEKIGASGANTLYFQAIRSHGGDGEPTHNPFVNSDPAQGLDEDILWQWDRWLSAMDEAGIAPLFFLYDDGASIWKTGDEVGEDEGRMLDTLVKRFEHHPGLMWCVAEEYGERYSPARIEAIAHRIREADKHDHVIAVHKNDGLSFQEFQDSPDIDQFAIQYNHPEPGALHAGMLKAWTDAAGRYNLNMSEAADHGFGAEARKKNWACAMGGAYVMDLRWLFNEPEAPSAEDLAQCGYLVRFFESTPLAEMAPHDELAAGATDYVLAQPGQAYVAYSLRAVEPLGLTGMMAGAYDFTWLDCATGTTLAQEGVTVAEGERAWGPPEGWGDEVAVLIERKTEKF